MSDNNLNYVNYDFDDLVQQLINRVKNQDAWKDIYESSTGQMMIELYAYIGNLVLYYIERRAQESYIEIAKNKSSVVNIAKLLNYNPRRRTSSTGILTFYVDVALASAVFIPRWTACMSVTNVPFLVTDDVVLAAGSLKVEANAMQGILVPYEVTSAGGASQEYAIDNIYIENTHVYVYVNDVLWTQVSTFLDSTNISEHYRLRTELDDTISILFGDDVLGKAPSSGDTIEIDYVTSQGSEGNLYNQDKITTISTQLYNALGVAATTVKVRNYNTVTPSESHLFLGGAETETIEEIRVNAPDVFATGDRYVTRADFRAVILAYPSVAEVTVWGENEETPPNSAMFNQLKVVMLLQNWLLPDTTFKTAMTTYLYTKSCLTVRYSYVDADVLEITARVWLYVTSGYTLSEVQQDAEDALEAQFTLGTTALLGESKRHSDLVYALEGVDGLSYVHLILDVSVELTANYDSFYDWGDTVAGYPMKAESVRIYIGDDIVAQDDGAGNLVSADTDYAVSGVAVLLTGYVGITLAPAAPALSTVSVRFEQDNSGDIVVTQGQICKLDDVDVEVISYE